MSWARGTGGGSSNAAKNADLENQLESQNEAELQALHGKIRSLRGVTEDIYSDSRTSIGIIDSASGTFDRFGTSLKNTSQRFARNVQSNQGNARLQLAIISAFVLLFIFFKLFRSGAPST